MTRDEANAILKDHGLAPAFGFGNRELQLALRWSWANDDGTRPPADEFPPTTPKPSPPRRRKSKPKPKPSAEVTDV